MARSSLRSLLAVGASLAACQPADRTGPTPPPLPDALRGRAIAIDIDLEAGTARVRRPAPAATTRAEGLSFALLGSNEISATVANLTRSGIGEFTPLRVRVRFDLSLTNRLLNADLVPSTFPTPPTGVNQVVAFPFATGPAGLFGLKVRASTDWNGTGATGSGAPHNFFNDAICIALTPPGDCFRWRAFGGEIAAGSVAGPQRVGFDVDPAITQFTVYVVVAADLRERSIPAGKGTVAGVISSPELGPLSGVSVNIGSGPAASTGSNGFYSFGGVDPGAYSVAISNLPSDCDLPPAQATTVVSGQVTVVSFTVSCPAATAGSVHGLVSSQLEEPLVGVGLSLTPGLFVATTDAEGEYSFPDLETGVYTVTVTAVPANCSASGLSTAVPVTPGYSATADFTVPCIAPDPAVGAVIITEFGQNPIFTDEQWIELYNATSTTIDLQAFHLRYAGTDCLIGPLAHGTLIGPGSVRTVVGTGVMTIYFGLTNSVFCGLSQTGATISQVLLLAPGGTLMDVVNATAAGFPPTGFGKTFSLDPSAFDATANDVGANWCLSTAVTPVGFGTPGAVNPSCPAPSP